MNVYIASFMLLLFNAVGVNTPAAAVAAETAENEAASQTELVVASDWEDSAWALLQSEQPFSLVSNTERNSKPAWSVVSLRSTIGDKLEHVEGAP